MCKYYLDPHNVCFRLKGFIYNRTNNVADGIHSGLGILEIPGSGQAATEMTCLACVKFILFVGIIVCGVTKSYLGKQ